MTYQTLTKQQSFNSVKMKSVALIVFFIASVDFSFAGYNSYIVPEPTIEAFSPKGLRISIPDEPGIEIFAVHANLNRPIRQLESGEMSTDVTKSDHGHWIYWNSEISVKPGDTLFYWLMVHKNGLGYRKDNGRYFFDKVTTLPDTTPLPPLVDCDETMHGLGSVHMPHLPLWDELHSQASSQLAGEKRSTYESSSSYSTNSKPIVRTSSSTIKGTYYVKPSGVEASGFKESSSFDSTKPEGQQWQHSRKELSADDLLRQPDLGHLKLRELTESRTHISPDMLPKTSSAVHTSSYYRKQVTSSDKSMQNPQGYNTMQYHRLQVPENNAQQFEHSYFQQTGGIPKQTITTPLRQVYKEESKYERSSSGPNSIYLTHTASNRGDTQRPIEVVPERRGQYSGTVFEISSTEFYHPADCKRYIQPGSDLNLDVRSGNSEGYDRLSRDLNELRCLSSLMETVLRTEIRRVKQQNDELTRKFALLEAQVKRFEDTCECVISE